MESVIVIDRKVIRLADLIAGKEISIALPSESTSIVLSRSENGQLIEIELVKDYYECECQASERVLRNVSAK